MCRENAKEAAENVTFHYFNETSGGVATIAVSTSKGNLYYGASFCSPRDRFVRAIGRTVALKRLVNNVHLNQNFKNADVTSSDKCNSTRHSIAYLILRNESKPSWISDNCWYPRKRYISPAMHVKLNNRGG